MNKYSIKYLIFCVASVILMSCTGLENVEKGVAGADGSWLVSASLSTGEKTRITELNNLLYWQEGDEVAFRAVSGSAAHVVSDQTVLSLNKLDSGLEAAKFRGTVTMAEQPSECYFAHPSNSIITGDGTVMFDFSVQDGRSHSPYLYGAASYDSAGISCVLKHAAALIRLKVPAGVTKVDVSANSLSSDVTFDMATQKISKAIVDQEGSVSITDDASDKISVTVDPSRTNYIFVPAISFTDGFSFSMETDGGDVIVKSYSVDGGKYSDYNFEAGSVIDIDFSGENTPEPLNISCTLSEIKSHDIQDGLLAGTTVSIQSFTVEGVPAKVIDAWGVAVYDGDAETGTMVRWVNGSGTFNSPGQPLAEFNGWSLLLPDRTYNIYAVCQINGKTHYVHSGILNVPELPTLTLSLQGETSYTIYKSQGASAANAKEPHTIYGISSSVNISPTLLNNSNYGFSLEVKAEGQTPKSHKWTYASNNSTNVYSLGTWDALSVGNYTLKCSMTFGGRTVNAADLTNMAITGLPYNAKMNNTEWKLSSNASFQSDNLKLGGGTGTATADCLYDFYIPGTTNVSVETNVTVTALYWYLGTQNTDFTVSLNSSQIIKQNSNNEKNGKNYTLTANSSLNAGNSVAIQLKSSYTAAGPKAEVYTFKMLYR